MDSFYGGKQGVDFVLRGSFTSVDAMIRAFKRGGSYTDIWYNEYCIIDTPNKNDKDNGKIYRRGLEYQNDKGGAIYVGQIVGPSSGTPYFQMNDIKQVQEYAKTSADGISVHKRYPTGLDSNGKYIISENGNGLDLGTFKFNKSNVLIPGKYEEKGIEKFNDDIKYTWCNIRADNADADSWFYVGWQQPFLVVDYSIHMTSSYDEDGNVLTRIEDISRVDDKTHPFYEHWDLGIPKGIKGDTLKNLRVIVPTASDKIYLPSAFTVNSDTGETIVGEPGYEGLKGDIAAGRQILVFDYYIYDKLRNPSPIMIYLGNFNIITSINVDDEGTLTVDYTHDDNAVFEKKIRWINGVALTEGNGTAGGHITFNFNNDNPTATQEFDISWIKGIEIEEDGSLIYSYAGTPEAVNMPENAIPVQADGVTGDPDNIAGFYRVEDFLQWIHDVNLNNQNGYFYVTNNRNEKIFDTNLDWIKDIQFSDEGTVTLIHTSQGEHTYNNLIKWINSVSLSQTTGKFTINWNYGEPTVTQLDWMDDFYINEDDGNIYIHHTNQDLNTVTPTGSNIPFDLGEKLPARLKLITGASVSSNGIITFTCNTTTIGSDGRPQPETIILNQTGQNGTAFQLKVIDKIILNTKIRDDKRIFVKYNTENTALPIGDPINYIQDMVVRPKDFHLLVLYNDPKHRYIYNPDELLDDNGKDKNGVTWVNNTFGSDGKSYFADDIYWRDMGTIKDQSGILIGFNVDSQEVEDAGFDSSIAGSAGNGETGKTGVCGYLQDTFPGGLTGEGNTASKPGVKHKIVTYTPPTTTDNPDKQDKEFYAFDYNTYKWYYLGKIADSGTRDAKLIRSTDNINDALQQVTTNGLLFKYSVVTSSEKAIPDYWNPLSTALNQ